MKRKIKPHALITKMKDYNETDFPDNRKKIIKHMKTLTLMTMVLLTLTFIGLLLVVGLINLYEYFYKMFN